MLPDAFGVSARVWRRYMSVNDSVAINYNESNTPLLFIGLEHDRNVPVATELSRFRTEVPGATFMEIAGLNHYMTPMNSPTVSQSLVDAIAGWLNLYVSVEDGMPETNVPETISVGPNPASEFIRFSVPAGRTYTAGIYSALGEKLTVYTITAETAVPVSTLPAGVYFIRLEGGGFPVIKTIVIAHQE